MSRRLLAASFIVALGASTAHAEDPPWARGITAEQKAKAQELLEAGNALAVENQHKEALARYTEAVAVWDHPAIRFNMVRALVALDRPLEAYENLEKALAYGAKPLQESVYQEALNYQRMLRRQVSSLEVTCTQRGVSIKLDGDVTIACPARQRVPRLRGTHRLIASGSGLQPLSRDVVLADEAPQAIAITLSAPGASGPRWAKWKPWAVVVAGAAVTGTGIVFNRKAHSTATAVDDRSQVECVPNCTEAEYAAAGLQTLEDRVDRENAISITALSVGGATLLVGGALVLLNRGGSERVVVDAKPGGATVGARFRF